MQNNNTDTNTPDLIIGNKYMPIGEPNSEFTSLKIVNACMDKEGVEFLYYVGIGTGDDNFYFDTKIEEGFISGWGFSKSSVIPYKSEHPPLEVKEGEQVADLTGTKVYDTPTSIFLAKENKALKETLLKIDAICYRKKGWTDMEKIAGLIKAALTPINN